MGFIEQFFGKLGMGEYGAFIAFTFLGMLLIKMIRYRMKKKMGPSTKFAPGKWINDNILDFIIAFVSSFLMYRFFPDALHFLRNWIAIGEYEEKMFYGLILGLGFQYGLHKLMNNVTVEKTIKKTKMTKEEQNFIRTVVAESVRSNGSFHGLNISAILQALIIAGIIGLFVKFNTGSDNDVIQSQLISNIQDDVNDVKNEVNDVKQSVKTLDAKFQVFSAKRRYTEEDADSDLMPIKNIISDLSESVDDIKGRQQKNELEISVLKSVKNN